MNNNNIPKHVAIIMDGNGRWAQEKKLPRTAGHREGIKRVKEAISQAGKLGVKFLTLFAFSSENWARPKEEINALMRYLDKFLDTEVKDLDKHNIRLVVIGRDDPLPKNIQNKLKDAQEATRGNTGMTVILALNYGSRQEIVDAAKKITGLALKGELNINELDEEKFAEHLYTSSLPDPDLLIRTSGQMRLSNFLLWQFSYTEFYFPRKYWPDFKKEDFTKAINEYKHRHRRFGAI